MRIEVVAIVVLIGLLLPLLYFCYRALRANLRNAEQGSFDRARSQDTVLHRRDFLRILVTGSVAAATSTVAAWRWPRREWDHVADVVVVGFGAAGAAASIEAADLGARVIILDKMPIAGGTTLMSGGTIYAAETSVQRAAGIDDSANDMFKLLMAAGGELSQPELVEVVANESKKTIDWLLRLGTDMWEGAYVGEPFGCELYPEYAYLAPPAPRVHVVKGMGEGLFGTLERSVRERGIEVMLDTAATELITAKGAIVGVRAQNSSGAMAIRARKGVILATGGFMYNRRLLEQYCRKGFKSLPLGNPGDEGDGLRMADEVGADLWPESDTVGLPAVKIPASGPARPLLMNYYGLPCVLIDRAGNRFVNEGVFYEFVNDALLTLEGEPPAYIVFDEVARTQAKDKIVKYFSPDLAREIAEGIVFRSGTVEMLSQKIGITPERLRKTIERYNYFARKGEDADFGRTEEMGLKPLERSPFYAIGVRPGMIATTGGVKINTKAQVLRVTGEPIPRLYAAGRTTGGVIGVVFPASGVNLQDAICFGRIAGRNAARA
jgi:fumarate reductase flavoprotein subunit